MSTAHSATLKLPDVTLTNYHLPLAIGSVVLLYSIISLLSWVKCTLVFLYRSWLRPSYDLVKRYGPGWAVVTGATDGIGKALAFDLARKGFHVLLVSRTQEKLDECKRELHVMFPQTRCETMKVDFNAKGFGPQQRKEVEAALGKLADGGLAILVNNVGVSYDYPCYFHELEEERVDDLTRINCDSTAFLTHAALKIMLARNVPRGCSKGAILNIGSSAGLFPDPLLSQYAAAKAYVQRLTEGLAIEYKPKGIDIQVTTPFFIVTKLSKFRRSSLLVPTAERFSKLLLCHVGYETVINPQTYHALLGMCLKSFPWTGNLVMWYHKGIRAKALKKKAGGVTVEGKKEL